MEKEVEYKIFQFRCAAFVLWVIGGVPFFLRLLGEIENDSFLYFMIAIATLAGICVRYFKGLIRDCERIDRPEEERVAVVRWLGLLFSPVLGTYTWIFIGAATPVIFPTKSGCAELKCIASTEVLTFVPLYLGGLYSILARRSVERLFYR